MLPAKPSAQIKLQIGVDEITTVAAEHTFLINDAKTETILQFSNIS